VRAIPVRLTILTALTLACSCTRVIAATEALESSKLRVELETSPYSFRVIERSSGQVLLASSATAFTEKRFPAREAGGITRTPNSVRATLTLEGSKDKAQVAFTFTGPEVLEIQTTGGNTEQGLTYQEFEDRGEHYYGIWEYPFGANIDNRGAEAAFLGVRQMPDVNYANVRAPFYVTSRGYGIYVETATEGQYSIAKAGKTGFAFRDTQMKYAVIYGPSYAEIFSRYNAMAGPSIMPPLWAFGSIWWRDDHHDDLRDVANAQEKVIQDADRLRELHIPAASIWLDRPYATGEHGWGNMDFDPSFPDPPKMIRDLKDRGMNLLLWIANRTSGRLFSEGTANYYLFEARWPAADVRRPEVYNWFKAQLDVYVRQGIRGYKIDRGEEDELPRSLENLNAILVPKLAAEGLSAAYGNDYFDFTRNVNDTARKYTAVWNGDTQCTFGGLAISVKNALRSGAINFPMWGSDTGGYIRVPEKEVFARWLEFSAFSPMMEILIGPKRTIWYDYDQELVGIAQKYVSLHHDLIPYTRSYLNEAVRTGMPVMRSLVFAFPADQQLADMWDEYLYGRDLLVAPVTSADVTARSVYLPAGRWMDYSTRASTYVGPVRVSSDAALGAIPVFVREGAIIPRGDILKANNNWDTNWVPRLRIEMFPSSSDASRFDYYTGEAVRAIEVTPGKDGIAVTVPDLGVNGTLEIYCRNVNGVQRDGKKLRKGSDYSYDSKAQKLTVSFQGAAAFSITGATGVFGSAAASR